MTGNRLRLHTVTCCAMLGAFALGCAGAASAQETVFVGGSGQAALELHLDALDRFDRPPPAAHRLLRHPGERGGGLNDVVLIPPNALEDTASGSANREQRDKLPEPVTAPKPPVAVALDPVLIEPTQPELKAVEPEPVIAKAPAKVEAVSRIDETRETTTAATTTAPSDSEVSAIDRSAGGPDGSIRIFFDGGSSDIPTDALGQITAIVNALANDPTQRLQLKAYAAAGADSASLARRLSLTRALTVRSVLIEQGVRSTRIDVRALGGKDAGDTPDRVDIFIIKR